MDSAIRQTLSEIGIAETDRDEITAIAPEFPNVLATVMERFYENLLRSSAAGHLVGIDIARLKKRQIDHWTRLFTEEIGEDYERRVMRIGIAHRDRQIRPDVYIRAYGSLSGELVDELMRRSNLPASELAGAVSAVMKLVHFDMTMALRAYEAALID